jgi:hypothetical protein
MSFMFAPTVVENNLKTTQPAADTCWWIVMGKELVEVHLNSSWPQTPVHLTL